MDLVDTLLARCAAVFAVSREELIGRSQRRHIAAARQAAMALLAATTNLSLAAIGDALGGRDHTTVAHGIQAAHARMRTDSAYAARMRQLTPARPLTPAQARRREYDLALRIGALESGEIWWTLSAFGYFAERTVAA